MEGAAHPGLQERLEAAMAGRKMMTAAASEPVVAPVGAETMILGVERTSMIRSMIGHDSGDVATAAAPEEVAAAVEGFEKMTVAGLPVGRGLDEMMAAGAEEVMTLSVEGLAIGAMAMGPETVSDPVPAPDLQAPLMGHGQVAHHSSLRVIRARSL